jgi:hypothetical protein
MQTRTDNHDPAAKLALRAYYLRTYHADTEPLIFDACQGSGLLWSELRKTFRVRYWGVDVKPRPGRLRIESQRVLAQPDLPFDVVDIDTYGLPWEHWRVLLPNITRPTTVFLTLGILPNTPAPRDLLAAAGLDRLPRLPGALRMRLCARLTPYALDLARRAGLAITDAREAVSGGHARYYGLRLTTRRALTKIP